MDANRLNFSAGAASVAVALILLAAKGWAWFATGSLTVAASLVDTLLDLLISLANFAALIYAARPADDEHRFGHTSIEDIAALGQAVVVGLSAILIAWQAFGRLFEPVPLRAEEGGIAVMALSIVLTLGLVWWQRRVATQTGSKVVAADALHYLSDLLPGVGAILALGASAAFGIGGLDPVLALIAAAVLLRSAWRIGDAAFGALMDREAPDADIARLEDLIREAIAAEPVVRGFHDLRTRTAGARLFVQVHLEFDGRESLRSAHDAGERVRHHVLAEFPQAEFLVHHDPV